MIVHVEKIIEDYNLFTKPAGKSAFDEKETKFGVFDDNGKQIYIEEVYDNKKFLKNIFKKTPEDLIVYNFRDNQGDVVFTKHWKYYVDKFNQKFECKYTHPYWGFRSKYIFDNKKYYTSHYEIDHLPYLLVYNKAEKKTKPYILINTQREKVVAEFYKGNKKESYYLQLPEIERYILEKKFIIDIIEEKAEFVALVVAINIIDQETASDVDPGYTR